MSSLIIERVAIDQSLLDFEAQKCLQLLIYKYKAIIKHMIDEQSMEKLLFSVDELADHICDVQQTWSMWSLGELGTTIAKNLIFQVLQKGRRSSCPFSPVESIPTCIEKLNLLWGPLLKSEISGSLFAIYSCWQDTMK